MGNIIRRYLNLDYAEVLILIVGIYLCYIAILRYKERKQGEAVPRIRYGFGLLFIVYIVFLLELTLLNRGMSLEYRLELEVFWSYKKVILEHDLELRTQILGNIIAFLPWGILLPLISEKARNFRVTVLSAFFMSAGIELMQLIFKCGLCELDDVMNNTLGAFIGYGIIMIIGRIWKKKA